MQTKHAFSLRWGVNQYFPNAHTHTQTHTPTTDLHASRVLWQVQVVSTSTATQHNTHTAHYGGNIKTSTVTFAVVVVNDFRACYSPCYGDHIAHTHKSGSPRTTRRSQRSRMAQRLRTGARFCGVACARRLIEMRRRVNAVPSMWCVYGCAECFGGCSTFGRRTVEITP